MVEETLEERVARLENDSKRVIPKGISEIITLVSPMILAVMGFWFTSELNSTSDLIEQNELEIRRLEVTQSLLTEVFDGDYDKAAAMKQLLTRVIKDQELAKEISAAVEGYLLEKIEELPADQGRLSASAETELKKLEEASRKLNADQTGKIREASKVFIVIQSLLVQSSGSRERSIAQAETLVSKGYEGAEVWRSKTGDGYYALVIGYLPAAEARTLLDSAILAGDATGGPNGAYLTRGPQFTGRVWPPAGEP